MARVPNHHGHHPPLHCSSMDAPCRGMLAEHARQIGFLPHHPSRCLKESATFALGLNYVQFAKLGLKPVRGGGKALWPIYQCSVFFQWPGDRSRKIERGWGGGGGRGKTAAAWIHVCNGGLRFFQHPNYKTSCCVCFMRANNSMLSFNQSGALSIETEEASWDHMIGGKHRGGHWPFITASDKANYLPSLRCAQNVKSLYVL